MLLYPVDYIPILSSFIDFESYSIAPKIAEYGLAHWIKEIKRNGANLLARLKGKNMFDIAIQNNDKAFILDALDALDNLPQSIFDKILAKIIRKFALKESAFISQFIQKINSPKFNGSNQETLIFKYDSFLFPETPPYIYDIMINEENCEKKFDLEKFIIIVSPQLLQKLLKYAKIDVQTMNYLISRLIEEKRMDNAYILASSNPNEIIMHNHPILFNGSYETAKQKLEQLLISKHKYKEDFEKIYSNFDIGLLPITQNENILQLISLTNLKYILPFLSNPAIKQYKQHFNLVLYSNKHNMILSFGNLLTFFKDRFPQEDTGHLFLDTFEDFEFNLLDECQFSNKFIKALISALDPSYLFAVDSNSRTIFHIAASLKLNDKTNQLLLNKLKSSTQNRNSCINLLTNKKESIISLLAKNGNLKAVKLFLSNGANINLHDISGNNVLHSILKAKVKYDIPYLINIVILILKENKNLVLQKNHKGKNPFICAASKSYNGLLALFAQLFPVSILDDMNDQNPYSALHKAAKHGYFTTIRFLVENLHININIQDLKHGSTPLHLAANKSQFSAFETLIKLGANPLIKDNNGNTPFDIALQFSSIDFIDSLSKLATFNMVQYDQSILISAVQNSSAESIFFKIFGCTPKSRLNSSDKYGSNLLMLAARAKTEKIFSDLLDNNADYLHKDYFQMNILHNCVITDSFKCAQILLLRLFTFGDISSIKQILNGQNVDGDTPIHLAIALRKDSFVSYLLRYKHLDLTLTNNKGYNPANYAMKLGHTYSAALLANFTNFSIHDLINVRDSIKTELQNKWKLLFITSIYKEETKDLANQIKNSIIQPNSEKIQIPEELKESKDPVEYNFNIYLAKLSKDKEIKCSFETVEHFDMIFRNKEVQKYFMKLDNKPLQKLIDILANERNSQENTNILIILYTMILIRINPTQINSSISVVENIQYYSQLEIDSNHPIYYWITNGLASIAETEYLDKFILHYFLKLTSFVRRILNSPLLSNIIPSPSLIAPIHIVLEKILDIQNNDEFYVRIKWINHIPIMALTQDNLNYYDVDICHSITDDHQLLIEFLVKKKVAPLIVETGIQVTFELYNNTVIPINYKSSILKRAKGVLEKSHKITSKELATFFNEVTQIIDQYGLQYYINTNSFFPSDKGIHEINKSMSYILRLKSKDIPNQELLQKGIKSLKEAVIQREKELSKDGRSIDELLQAFKPSNQKFEPYKYAFDGTPVNALSQDDLQQLKEFSNLLIQVEVPTSDIKGHALEYGKSFKNTPNIENCAKLIALLRKAIYNTFEINPYTVQCLTVFSLLLHRIDKETDLKGRIAQVATGEGKSIIVAMLSAAIALTGNFVDIISSTQYLAQRDAEHFKPFYSLLGLTSGSFEYQKYPMNFDVQILYSTNTSFEFARLKEGEEGKDTIFSTSLYNKRLEKRNKMSVVVDEADNLFIDTAQNSARISHPMPSSINWIYPPIYNEVSHNNTDVESIRTILSKVEHGKHIEEVKKFSMDQIKRWISSATKAILMEEGVDYIIGKNKENNKKEVQIIDKNTGRIVHGSRWANGIHEFVEVKAEIEIQSESGIISSISHPSYFEDYKEIYGLTGTLGEKQERDEILQMYKLGNFDVPPNKKCLREKKETLIFLTQKQKHESIIKIIEQNLQIGRPTLVIVFTIQESEELSAKLRTKSITHHVLNDKQKESEDFIVDRAGKFISVTIATNAAGRGTDIKLDKTAERNGGLHVIIAFFPENLRVECQGLGRAGRQGQKGSCQLIISLEQQQKESCILVLSPDKIKSNPIASDDLLKDIYNQRTKQVMRTSNNRIISIHKEKERYQVLKKFFVYLRKLKNFLALPKVQFALKSQKTNIDISFFADSIINQLKNKWCQYYMQSEYTNVLLFLLIPGEEFANITFSDFLKEWKLDQYIGKDLQNEFEKYSR